MEVGTSTLDPKIAAFLDREHGLFIEASGVPPAPDVRSRCGILRPERRSRASPWRTPTMSNARSGRLMRPLQMRAGVAGPRPARERILLRFADLIEAEADALAQLETLEQGKSIEIARHVEVSGGIDFTRYAAGLATKITGMNSTAYTRRQPVGVVAGITPWNFPFAIALWKIVPALAAGCTVVLKPSEVTRLTALRLAELALEAGVPRGVFNLVTGDGEAGHALVASPLVAKISFTGSTATGKAIGRAAMDRMARVSLELGGKNPSIVLDDADLDMAVPGIMLGAFLNQGQVCSAASRLYVHAAIFDRVASALEGAIGALKVGPGIDPANQVNPLVSEQHRAKVSAFLEEAGRSSEIVPGADGPDPNGFYVPPTLVISPDPALRLNREEVFGPVLTMQRVADAEEAIRLANDTPYGLAASLWTRDLKMTLDLVPRIDAGTVWVNTHIPLDPNLPFGGFKQSGSGREFGPRWVEAFTEEKSVCIVH